MRYWVTTNRHLCLTVTILFYVAWPAAASPAAAEPVQVKPKSSIVLSSTFHDFGQVVQGETLSTTFNLRNTGIDAVSIYGIESDHPNVEASSSIEILEPGKEGTVEVSLSTAGVTGKIESRITINTSDEGPDLSFQVTAIVEPLLHLTPPMVFAGQVGMDASYSGEVQLQGKLVDDGKAGGLTVAASSETTQVTLRHGTVKDKEAAFVEFVLPPEMRAGSFKEIITISSENPPVEAKLEVVGQKLGIIKFEPAVLDYLEGADLEDTTRAIVLECDKAFEIGKYEDLSGFLDLKLEVLTEGHKYRLVATRKPSMPGSFMGVVQVHTNLEENPLIDIPAIANPLRPKNP